jgi:ribonuclease P protein component
MLPKQYQLKKRNAFSATYRTGKSFHNDGVTVFCGKVKNSNAVATKIGFVVSKKIHKRAVVRNRIKRLMRESLRLYIKEVECFDSKYISLVFVASTKLLNKDFKYINNAMRKLVSTINA